MGSPPGAFDTSPGLMSQEFCSDMRRGVRGSRPPSWSRRRAWDRCSRAWTDLWTPRRICLFVSSANHRSTRLSQDGPVATVQGTDHLAAGDLQSGEWSGGAGPDVVVGGPLRKSGHHRQHRLRAVQGLDLRLLVDTEHQSPLRRVQIETDDVVDLVDEVRIRRRLECLRALRLQAERPPDPRHGRPRQTQFLRHGARRPVGRVLGGGLQRLGNQRGHLLVRHRPRAARTRRVTQIGDSTPRKPRPPAAHRMRSRTELPRPCSKRLRRRQG